MKIEPIVLRGEHVRLEPMSPGHVDGLAAVGLEPSIWEFMVDRIIDRDGMRLFVEKALTDQAQGRSLPFVTRLAATDEIVGTSRFGNISTADRRVEIGWTWIAPERQRSAVNTEAKLLMLTHAFEIWKCIRVEFKTDALNQRSRTAIRRLGAIEEGTLRQHMITDTGRFRDSVYFSILDNEWPQIRSDLRRKLGE
ncbi:MAG: GNAT family N-acetyltransferase [Acidobacteria bacterium]|nr:GNAT family N-acetyltransferase [Acidobacteriota bacterium]